VGMQNDESNKVVDLKESESNESFLLNRGFRFVWYKVWWFLDKKSQASVLSTCKELNRYVHANIPKVNHFLGFLELKQVNMSPGLPYAESEVGDRENLIAIDTIEKKAGNLFYSKRKNNIAKERNNLVRERINCMRNFFQNHSNIIVPYFFMSLIVYTISVFVDESQKENTQNTTANNTDSNSTNIDAQDGLFGGAFTTITSINLIIASLLQFVAHIEINQDCDFSNFANVVLFLLFSLMAGGGLLLFFGDYIIEYNNVLYDVLFLSLIVVASTIPSCLRCIYNSKTRELQARSLELQLDVNDLQESLLTPYFSKHNGGADNKDHADLSARI
jgi:hypothetical protein